MKKLHELKLWLTVPDATRHLGVLFGHDVSDADVLRLGLDGHLTLSVDFVNHAVGRLGHVVSMRDAKRETVPSLTGDASIEVVDGFVIDDDRVIKWDPELVEIVGVWDLPMMGAERLDVEHQCQLLSGGPEVELSSVDATLIRRHDGIYCQVLTRFENAKERPWFNPRNYHPAGGLPKSGALVVRTSSLREFEARISKSDVESEKPVEQRERTTLLVVIAALAKMAKIDWTKPSAAAAAIEGEIARMGARVAARTIENHLNRIPEALESRRRDL